MEEPKVSLTYLPTAEDYRWYKLDCARLSSRKTDRVGLTVIGAVLAAAGCVGGALFSRSAVNYIAWGLCIFTGLISAAYFSLVEPVLISWKAQRRFQKISHRLTAQTMEFGETGVRIRNDRSDGFYPYEILHRCIRTRHFILIFFGVGDSAALALRIAGPGETGTIVSILRENLGEKYLERLE